jgi:hypothetical protein
MIANFAAAEPVPALAILSVKFRRDRARLDWEPRHFIRKYFYADLVAGDFAISEKVSGRSQKQFLFWDLRSKKAIASGCNPRGWGLQGEVRRRN